MPRRTLTALVPDPPHAREILAHDGRVRISLTRLGSGVAEGRTLAGRGSARSQWWALFNTGVMFDACAAHDPLRFSDPLAFVNLRTEFSHVVDDAAIAQSAQ
jgi:hypothetical protein